MSLVNRITYRQLQDMANEGIRISATGLSTGATDQVLVDLSAPITGGGTASPTLQTAIVTGYYLSTTSASPVPVTLGFRGGSPLATSNFFECYVGGTAGSVSRFIPLGDWKFGAPGYSIVMTSTVATVAFTIDGRITAEKMPRGFIEHEGTDIHHTGPLFAPESGLARGESEF